MRSPQRMAIVRGSGTTMRSPQRMAIVRGSGTTMRSPQRMATAHGSTLAALCSAFEVQYSIRSTWIYLSIKPVWHVASLMSTLTHSFKYLAHSTSYVFISIYLYSSNERFRHVFGSLFLKSKGKVLNQLLWNNYLCI